MTSLESLSDLFRDEITGQFEGPERCMFPMCLDPPGHILETGVWPKHNANTSVPIFRGTNGLQVDDFSICSTVQGILDMDRYSGSSTLLRLHA